MGTINVNALALQMADATKGIFIDNDDARAIADKEYQTFADNMAAIQIMAEKGEIDEEDATVLAQMHQRSMRMVITAIRGIELAMLEKAVNDALDIIRDAVNKAVGWPIL